MLDMPGTVPVEGTRLGAEEDFGGGGGRFGVVTGGGGGGGGFLFRWPEDFSSHSFSEDCIAFPAQ